MRDMVRSYFMASLDRYVERLNDTGLPDQTLDLMRQELDVHEGAGGGYDDLSDLFRDGGGTMDSFRASAGRSDAQWTENEPALRHELRKARRDQIKAILSAAERLEGYSYARRRKGQRCRQKRSLCLSVRPWMTLCRNIFRNGQTRWQIERRHFWPSCWNTLAQIVQWQTYPAKMPVP